MQLTEKGPLVAHARYELGIDPDELTNAWQAAWASMLAFALGALVPLAAILLSARAIAVPVTAVAVVIVLAITGSVSALLGGAGTLPQVMSRSPRGTSFAGIDPRQGDTAFAAIR